MRPRTLAYAAMIALIGGAMAFALVTRSPVGATVVHVRMPMFTMLKDGGVRNGYDLRIANKRNRASLFAISARGPAGATLSCEGAQTDVGGAPVVTVAPDSDAQFHLLVTLPPGSDVHASAPVSFRVVETEDGETAIASDHVFAP